MSNAELIQPDFQLPYPSDIEDGETLREYAICIKAESEYYRERVAVLKDSISSVILPSEDKNRVIELCEIMLSNA
jgi:hypothetical protein